MSDLNEINYGTLIDRLIKDFQPVKRLWPINLRLALWMLLETAVLALAVLLNGRLNGAGVTHPQVCWFGAAEFILLSAAAAWIALRNSIPGRETGAAELIALAAGIIAAALTVQFVPSAQTLSLMDDLPLALGQQWSLAALPWVALFWAARRALPLRPRLAGAMIGLAASCFAIAAGLLGGPLYLISGQLLAGAFFTGLSFIAGWAWLAPERLWRKGVSAADQLAESAWLNARFVFPITAALATGMLVLVLRVGTGGSGSVPDFDLAIANYQQSLTDFRPNVPSKSIETLLTAYIEHGMPSYMWDFGPQGFTLVGGRFDHLADGSPVTYTWFRGTKAGVMCMFRQVSGFRVPTGSHVELHHVFFYRYRGYSVCLLNLGGYGDFVSVIVSPLPMKPFLRMVLAALS